MKYIGGALWALVALVTVTGLVPWQALAAQGQRVWSVLLFVAAISVVAALANAAGVFDMAAAYAARAARGRTWLLWVFVTGLSLASTIFLSLDTTAVLLTPTVVYIAKRARVSPLPFALTTIWLANAGSLLLPVSNLTNLLAQHRLGVLGQGGAGAAGFGIRDFVALSWPPALACALVPIAVLAVIYRKQLFGRFDAFDLPPARHHDRPLLAASAAVVIVLLPLLASGLPVWIPASGAALVLVGLFSWRARPVLNVRLLPWSFLLFASGLFAAVAAAQALGLGDLVNGLLGRLSGTGAAPTAGGAESPGIAEGGPVLLLVAASAAVLSNLIDNLPAYLVLEPATGNPAMLMATLVGVNAGVLVIPWASLATLLWHRQLGSVGVEISWRRFMRYGAVCAPLTVVAGVGAIALAG